jgi:hypothetical protein
MPAVRAMRAPYAVSAMLFVLVWISCVWFGSYALNPNNATRLFAAIALVEQGDARIDHYQSLTIDKAQFGEGRARHYYTDKAPGMTLMAVPAVWAVDSVTGEQVRDQVIDIANLRLARVLGIRLTAAVASSTALLTAIAAVLLLDLGTGITGSPAAGMFGALGYALGSIVWGWSTSLFGHAPVAALLLIATWAIWRRTADGGDRLRWRYPVMAGFALGWAVAVEFQAALSGIAIGAWALWRTRDVAWPLRRRILGTALVSATAAIVPLLAYNGVAFGTPFRTGYEGVVGFDGMNQGLFGLTYPKPAVVWQILCGTRRGLLWVSPVLVVGGIGLIGMIRRAATCDLGWLAAAVIAIVLSVNASYFYWDGGASIGPRHSVPAIAFLAIGLAPFWASLRTVRARYAASALLGVSILLNLLIASTDIFAPETLAVPVWTRNFLGLLLAGKLATLPNLFWGWNAWFGLALYLDIALPLLGVMLWRTRRAERGLSE